MLCWLDNFFTSHDFFFILFCFVLFALISKTFPPYYPDTFPLLQSWKWFWIHAIHMKLIAGLFFVILCLYRTFFLTALLDCFMVSYLWNVTRTISYMVVLYLVVFCRCLFAFHVQFAFMLPLHLIIRLWPKILWCWV